MNGALLFFIILYLSGGILDLKKGRIKGERFSLMLFSIILALFSGLRSERWPDTSQYIYAFCHEIKTLPNFKGSSDITIFTEPGFVNVLYISGALSFGDCCHYNVLDL